MSALTAPRNVLTAGKLFSPPDGFPVYQATKIFTGAIIALNGTGYVVNASDAASLTVLGWQGRAIGNVDNTNGSSGDLTASPEQGVGFFLNDGTNPCATVGGIAYVKDNQTVCATAGSTYKLAAGLIVKVTSAGVWVDMSAEALAIAVARAAVVKVAATSHTITDSSTGTASTSALEAMSGVDGTGSNAAPLTATKNNIATLGAELALVKADIAAIKSALA